MGQNLQNPNSPVPKWEGKVSATLPSTNADDVFTLFKDFFNLHKWFPTLSASRGVSGANGAPGCVRLCVGSSFAAGGGGGGWSKERLVALDEEGRSLSYEMVECNIGLSGYRSTVRISPAGEGGCVIEWSFAVDPVNGMRVEDLVRKYEVGLQCMASRMESALRKSTVDELVSGQTVR